MTATLTVSGNEITDALRALGVSGDGRLNDSSFGIWEPTTNLLLFSRQLQNAAWTKGGGATPCSPADDTQPNPAGVQRASRITPGTNDIYIAQSRPIVGASAGRKWTSSYWVRAVTGNASVRVDCSEEGGASGTQISSQSTIVGQAWTRVSVTRTFVANDRTNAGILIYSPQNTTPIDVWGAALEEKPIATPYPESGAAAGSRAGARVQAPATLMNATRGWVAVRLRMGYASGVLPSSSLPIFDWRDDANNRLTVVLNPNTGALQFTRLVGGVGSTLTTTAKTWAAGAVVTVIADWSATALAISWNGGAREAAANTSIPTLSASLFDIGSSAGIAQIDSDAFWFACGTGTLTDADVAAIHAFGNTDKAPEDFNVTTGGRAACTATMPFATASYLDEAFTIIDPAQNGSSRVILPRLRVDIDFTNDPTNATRVWTDVTSKVRRINYTSAGRNTELQRTEPGTLNAALDNRDGRFDPTNTGSPYYPGVRRRRWIRVRARYGVTDYTRWTGLIETWRQKWPAAGKDALVEIAAADASKILNLFDLDGKSYSSQRTDQRVASVCTDVGGTYTLADAGQTTLDSTGVLAESTSALSHLQQVEETENGLVFAAGDGTITFQSRRYRTSRTLAGIVATFGENAGEIPYSDNVEFDLDDGDIATEAKVTPNGGAAQLWPRAGITTAEKQRHFTSRLNRSILTSSASEALACAQYLVHRYGDPSPRLPQLQAIGPSVPANWPTILSLKNSDYVAWKRRASANSISLNVFVERYADTVEPASKWDVAFLVSPATDEIPWIAADPVYGLAGSTTKAGY